MTHPCDTNGMSVTYRAVAYREWRWQVDDTVDPVAVRTGVTFDVVHVWDERALAKVLPVVAASVRAVAYTRLDHPLLFVPVSGEGHHDSLSGVEYLGEGCWERPARWESTRTPTAGPVPWSAVEAALGSANVKGHPGKGWDEVHGLLREERLLPPVDPALLPLLRRKGRDRNVTVRRGAA